MFLLLSGPLEMYQFMVSEGAAIGTPVGRVIATDADMGENTDMSYLIQEGGELFKVTTDAMTQEAVVSIKKVRANWKPLNGLVVSIMLPNSLQHISLAQRWQT